MTRQHQEMLTVTLHWLIGDREQTTTIVCEDSPPETLLPLLIDGCGLPVRNERGDPIAYTLRLASPAGRLLRPAESASAQGVRSGSHLWLTEGSRATPRRCLLGLPDGSEVALPPRGVTLSRAWLLQALALLNLDTYHRELDLLEQRRSLYRYVSNRPHCLIAPIETGPWSVSTGRTDVATLLNGMRIAPGASEPLRDGDILTLGEEGLSLSITLIGDIAA